MERPDDFVQAVERYSCSVVSIIGWGRRIDRMNDYVAQCALGFMEAVDYIVPGQFIMEAIPFLSSLPGWLYPLPSKILNSARLFQRYFYALCQEGAELEGENFAKRLLAEQTKTNMSNAEIACLTGNLIGGGVDTTSSSTLSFILAMCVFQDVQKKAQEEIDSVVGGERSPDWSDEASLPYVKAVVNETLRWRTVTILGGIPHAPIQVSTIALSLNSSRALRSCRMTSTAATSFPKTPPLLAMYGRSIETRENFRSQMYSDRSASSTASKDRIPINRATMLLAGAVANAAGSRWRNRVYS